MQINRFSRFQIGEESEDWPIFLALILKSDPGAGVAFFSAKNSSTLLGVSLNVGCKKADIFPAGFRIKMHRSRDEVVILFLKRERSIGFEVISKSFLRRRILKMERDTQLGFNGIPVNHGGFKFPVLRGFYGRCF
jgi:hypothetical protein